MQHCSDCYKPLTEFEVSFHQKAKSPPEMSNKCWKCSGASQIFDKARFGKKNHTIETIICIAYYAVIIGIFAPLWPYMNMTFEEVPNLSIEISIIVAEVLFFVLSIASTISIFCLRKGSKIHKPAPLDPQEEHYRNVYGLNTTEYVSKERYDGAIVTEKVTHIGGETKDQWINDGQPLSFTAFLITPFGWALAVLIFGTFFFWAIPYVIIVSIRDSVIRKRRLQIPRDLSVAYLECCKNEKISKLSFHDKVGFLKSREKCALQATKPKDFIDYYTSSKSSVASIPFWYRKYGNEDYMIVDYHCEICEKFGVAFVLVRNEGGDINKKMVVGNEFVATNEKNWFSDWVLSGANKQIIENIEWYEAKFVDILNDPERNNTISG